MIHSSTSNLLHAWQLPPFTFSFNIVMILLLLAANNHAITLNLRTSTPSPLADNYGYIHNIDILYLIDTGLRGVGQFMNVDTTIGSAFVVAGIAISSRTGACVAVYGALVGFIMSFYILHVPLDELYNVRMVITVQVPSPPLLVEYFIKPPTMHS